MDRAKGYKPILRWPGGKTRMLHHLLPLVPKHTCYVEPFAGGLALLLAKQRSPVEVVNDVNGDLVSLYRCVQYHLPELLREISFLISSRQCLKEFVDQRGLTDIQRAARFYYRNRVSFGGNLNSFAVAKTRGGGAGFPQVRNADLLGQANERLSGVVIENIDYERCLNLYDSPETFFFLDPPYLGAKINAYSGWNEDQVESFAKRVKSLKGKWIVTLDDSLFNREAFKGCQITAVSTNNGAVNQRKNGAQRFGEIIVTA